MSRLGFLLLTIALQGSTVSPVFAQPSTINRQMFKFFAITVIHAEVRILRTRESLKNLFSGLDREPGSSSMTSIDHRAPRLFSRVESGISV
jgi:hypothetical protein